MCKAWYKIQYFLGKKICPDCGSTDLTQQGFEGVNLRWKCNVCGSICYQPGSD